MNQNLNLKTTEWQKTCPPALRLIAVHGGILIAVRSPMTHERLYEIIVPSEPALVEVFEEFISAFGDAADEYLREINRTPSVSISTYAYELRGLFNRTLAEFGFVEASLDPAPEHRLISVSKTVWESTQN